MATFSGNINDLFSKSFGIYTNIPVYYMGDSKPEKLPPQSQPPVKSKLNGAYLFDRFSFQISEAGLSFDKQRGNNEVVADVWSLPDASVVEFARAKNIVQTMMPGKDGTVKELVSMGDWEITFRGFIINRTPGTQTSPPKQTHEFPLEYIRQMNAVFSVNQNMKVYSRLVNNLKIFKVVITSLRFPALEGYSNVQPYEMTCLSDEDIILDLRT